MYLLVVLLLLAHSLVILTVSNTSSLQARYFNHHASCNRRIPGDPSRRKYDYKAAEAFDDAQTLATRIHADFDAFYRTTAYTHYFRREDKQKVSAVYEKVAWIFSPSAVAIPYYCGSDQFPEVCLDCTGQGKR